MPISIATSTYDVPIVGTPEEYQELCQQVSELTIEEATDELFDAARYGESDIIRAILTTFDVVNAMDADHSTPLHKACANGHAACVQVLLQFDATHKPNLSGNTPLHWAAANGHDAVVQLLLNHYSNTTNTTSTIDVLTKNMFGRSALTEGFASDNVLVANLLLSHDSATEEKLLQGATPIDDENNDDPMDIVDHSITHGFVFGTDSATQLDIRELPIAHADDPFGQLPEQDTTGYGIWAASLVMAQWMTTMSHRFANKNILELGAGCGVPGLAVAKSSQANSVVVTDLNGTTVENLQYNVQLNDFGSTKTTSAKIDWDDESTYPTHKMDVIIGSDLIYQKSIVPYLKKVVLGLLKQGEGRFLYVAPDTGRDGLDDFINSMKKDGFQLVSQQVAPKAFHCNPLANGDDDECYLHFHELASSTYVLYEFERTISS